MPNYIDMLQRYTKYGIFTPYGIPAYTDTFNMLLPCFLAEGRVAKLKNS